jgi:hypothetical protein
LLAASCTRSTPTEKSVALLPAPQSTAKPKPAAVSISGTTLKNPSPPHPQVDAYPGIIVDAADELKIPGKYKCGDYTITPPDFATGQGHDLVLWPSGKLLLRITDQSAFQYDITFGKGCERLYWVDSLETNSHIHVEDLTSGKTSVITIPDSDFPPSLVINMGQQYYPLLKGLYAVDAEHLLLSFENPTTGKDAFTNQSSQAIYDLTTGEVVFISEGGGSPPVLLNYKTNTLILPEQGNLTTVPITSRVEIDLETHQKTTVRLKAPYEYTIPCDRNAFDNEKAYLNCKNAWLSRLLQ